MMTLDEAENTVRQFQKSRIILTAVELDLFSILGSEGADLDAVCAALQSDSRATEILLDALTAMGLLHKNERIYVPTAIAQAYLMTGAEEDKRAIFAHMNHLWDAWSQLTSCIRSGRAARTESRTEEEWRAFIGAMHGFALEQAPAFMSGLDLGTPQRILDLGGGSGAYAITFCRRYPHASVTVFDRAEVIKLTHEYVQAAGLEDRIELRDGDILEDPIGADYDLIWMSNVVHSMGRENVKRTLAKSYDALVTGGCLLLRDFILTDNRTAPEFAAVFAVNMLVATPAGNCYSESEYRNWLDEAGFTAVQKCKPDNAGNTELLIAGK